MIAWLLTITFVPAFVMFIPPRLLENFGARHDHEAGKVKPGGLGRFLHWMGGATYRQGKVIVAIAVVVLAIAGYGISKINVNDNPVKWFTYSHPIRVADRVLNQHFGGTYMAYLSLAAEEEAFDASAFTTDLQHAATRAASADDSAWVELMEQAKLIAPTATSPAQAYQRLLSWVNGKIGSQPPEEAVSVESATAQGRGPALPEGLGDTTPSLPNGLDLESSNDALSTGKTLPADQQTWQDIRFFLEAELQRHREVFKHPDALRYIEKLQAVLADTGIVGKSNSLADLVKTVHRDLYSGDENMYVVPDSFNAVGQCISQFENSHRPHDLAHFVTVSDAEKYRKTAIWVQLTSGDNKDMSHVVRTIEKFVSENPPPANIGRTPKWFGLTFINVVWQEKMVTGMLEAFGGSFLVVFLLMVVLFRSPLWGLLSMIPLTVTIGSIYGAIGLIGKDYDMPVAVLSSLTLGLAVDFAIHFLVRSREMQRRYGSWKETAPNVFGEPARAIMRNIIVIAAGFLPLLLAPLVPYKTVGILLATILLVSGIGTLLLLPAMIRLLSQRLFRQTKASGILCNCGACVISSVALTALILLNVQTFHPGSWTTSTWIAAICVPVLTLLCGLLSRRQKCRLDNSK
ncbi:MAG: MMPL family transporter [Planctomycetes bacterium]|nr:MMPL family transporter [Planctomycetota bacterium]